VLVGTDVSVSYPGSRLPALAGVSLEVKPHGLVAVVGPNGGGKTTLLRALMGSIPLQGGTVELLGKPIGAWSPRERARIIGAVTQREEYPFAWRVDEVVSFGRYARLSALAGLTAPDRAAIERAMIRADVLALGSRRIDTLSGGEWQRVRIARALAQEPALLALDEPTASLDFGHEMEIFELIRELVRDGLAGVLVTHHLNLAARFADEIILLHQGRAAARGRPSDVLTPDRLAAVFGWPVQVSEVDGVPQITPRRRGGAR
jgi:iron complex transport system ATP-binding protein